MVPSWPDFWGKCKSRLTAIGRECFLSREKWKERAIRWRKSAKRLEKRVTRLTSTNENLKQEIKQLKADLSKLKSSPLPSGRSVKADPNPVKPPGCQYSSSEISLSVNLACKIGLRPTVKVLKVVYDWLQWDNKVPTYQTIRSWTQRIGLDRTEHAQKIDGATWIVDHTCQTGKEKVLTVLRVRSDNSLKRQQPLKFSDVELLAEVCRSTWTDDDVFQVLYATSQKYGTPGNLLSDQARNLQKPAFALQKSVKGMHVLVDFKHFLASQFKLILKTEKDFPQFTKQLQQTCARVQQTVLSHFVPRPLKRKSRFMNLGPVLKWAEAMLWHLDHPESQARADISQERMEEKFGWLRALRVPISHWQQCQDVIDTGVNLINKQGLSQSTADEFRKLVGPLTHCPESRKLVKNATEFLHDQAAQLRKGETVPMSTEILESLFASYKELEKQHSKEGFSSLLLALGTLLRPVSEKEVMRAFKRTKCADVSQWVKNNLGSTYMSKRQDVFREPRQHRSKPTNNRATPIAA